MFPVIFRARRQYYITWGCNKTWHFLLLPLRGEKAWLHGGTVLQGSYRFHRFILSESPSRRNIYTRKYHANTSILLPLNAQGDYWKDSTINKKPEGCWEEYNMLYFSPSSIFFFSLALQFHLFLASFKYFRRFNQWIFHFKPPGNQSK